jgi:hypothetical protein
MDSSVEKFLTFWEHEATTAEACHSAVAIAPAELRILLNLVARPVSLRDEKPQVSSSIERVAA